jgi:hypothetical protein
MKRRGLARRGKFKVAHYRRIPLSAALYASAEINYSNQWRFDALLAARPADLDFNHAAPPFPFLTHHSIPASTACHSDTLRCAAATLTRCHRLGLMNRLVGFLVSSVFCAIYRRR